MREGLERGLTVSIRSVNDVTVLAVRGELDVLTAPRLAEALDAGLAETPTAVIVDLSEVEFLASAGMAVLLDAQRTATRLEKRFGTVADGPITCRPMKLMGLDQMLRLFPTLEVALSNV